MAEIKLTDQFGADFDAQPAPASAFLRYFRQLPSLKFDQLDIRKLQGLALDDPLVRSLATGVSFDRPVDLGEGAPALSIAGGAQASFRVDSDADDVPGSDDTESPTGCCYVRVGLKAKVSAGVTAAAGALSFGATPSSSLEFTSALRFRSPGSENLLDALRETVAAFSIPASAADLAGLAPGQVTKAALRGKLTLQGSANLFASANPLASVNLPAPLPAASVSAGGSATVGVSCVIEAEYEVVARLLDSGKVRVGWYHKTGTEVSVSVTASEGIAAGFGGNDLFSQVVRAISGDAAADLDELKKAGVPDEQATAIQSAVGAAAQRKLEIAVGAEFTAGGSSAATFLYEIDAAALTDQSRAAVDAALRGDLAGLHAPGLGGVSCARSLWDDVRKREIELSVNLLGILNYRSIASLTLEGKVLCEPDTGTLVITDTATATRIQVAEVNFLANADKLRSVLAESFLITAAYRGVGRLAAMPGLRSSHHFFELRASMGRAEMARKLRAGVALGLLARADAAPPEGVDDFGRTLVAASADYDEDLLGGMFLDGGAPWPHAHYEAAGRRAIAFLVQEGDVDQDRRRPALDDNLWRRMSDSGQPGFPHMFPGVPAPIVGAITADYSVIQWWADAMSSTARKLAELRGWLAQHSSVGVDDAEFQGLREGLAAHLRNVASNTRSEFGDPWGLIAMSLLAGQRAGAQWMVTSPKLVKSARRALAAGAGK